MSRTEFTIYELCDMLNACEKIECDSLFKIVKCAIDYLEWESLLNETTGVCIDNLGNYLYRDGNKYVVRGKGDEE